MRQVGATRRRVLIVPVDQRSRGRMPQWRIQLVRDFAGCIVQMWVVTFPLPG
jgi:hypothetical protein